MWYLLYNSLLLLISPVILFVLLAKQRCRRGLLQRLGLRAEMPTTDPAGRSGCIWIHAVSLGEVVAVAPLVRDLRRRYPETRLIVSTVTETGREAVESGSIGRWVPAVRSACRSATVLPSRPWCPSADST